MNNADMPALGQTKRVGDVSITEGGLTKREHFCLQMGVPETGDPELDDIIRKGNRQNAAMAAMQGLLSSQESSIVFYFHGDQDNTIARMAVNHANNLLAELAKVPT